MRVKITLNYFVIVMLIITCLIVQPVFAKSDSPVPGTVPATQINSLSMISAYPVTPHSIVPEINEVGKISWSIDGLGVYPGSTGTIQVEKPAGATVRSAYLFAASTPDNRIYTNDILFDMAPVVWDIEIPSSIGSYNYMTDVTYNVKNTIDSAPAGRVDFTIEEYYDTAQVDGVILVVIFDDPAQTTDNTVVLLFGAQKLAGDDFNIGLADPLDLTDPNLALDFSLGISFSNQDTDDQYSIVDVNGIRMTSWAGGDDDGTGPLSDGELITVGGLDDSTVNPADPNANPIGDKRYDDELYTLLPFVKTGDTQIQVHTQNPSNDDNMFFAGLFIRSATALVGKGIILSPAAATNPLNTQHTLTAKVQDDDGNPVVGEEVTIEVTAGPNAGTSGTGPTDKDGQLQLTYLGTTAGTDTIIASFVDDSGKTITSNEATKKWEGEGPILTPEFPSTFLPVTMIIGFLGAVLLIQRTRK